MGVRSYTPEQEATFFAARAAGKAQAEAAREAGIPPGSAHWLENGCKHKSSMMPCYGVWFQHGGWHCLTSGEVFATSHRGHAAAQVEALVKAAIAAARAPDRLEFYRGEVREIGPDGEPVERPAQAETYAEAVQSEEAEWARRRL